MKKPLHLFVFSLLLLALVPGLSAQRLQWHRAPAQGTSSSNPVARVADHDYPTVCYDFLWDSLAAAWDSSGMYTYTYHPNGNVAEQVYAYNFGTGFVNSSRNTYVLNAMGFDSISYYQFWQGGTWANGSRTHTWYNAQGDEALSFGLSWNGTAFDTTYGYRYTYTYHSSNQPLEVIEEGYNPSNSTWENSERAQHTFNAQDQIETETYSNWSNGWFFIYRGKDYVWFEYPEKPYSALYQTYVGNTWENDERFNGTYGNRTQTWTIENWNGNAWENNNREVTRYDAHDHYTYNASQLWDDIGQTWVNDYVDSIQSSYTANGQLSDEINLDWRGGNNYVNSYRRTCANFFTSAPAPSTPSIAVQAYPNPVTDVLHFDLGEAKPGPVAIGLYDLQGRLRVATTAPSRGTAIPVQISETLEAGTYFYRVQTREGVATGKVVIAR